MSNSKYNENTMVSLGVLKKLVDEDIYHELIRQLEESKEYRAMRALSTDMPFGKYAGISLIELAENKRYYLKYLMKQDWFKNDFIDLYNEVMTLLQN
jgi:uncharacterized protein (DUF3820 family)